MITRWLENDRQKQNFRIPLPVASQNTTSNYLTDKFKFKRILVVNYCGVLEGTRMWKICTSCKTIFVSRGVRLIWVLRYEYSFHIVKQHQVKNLVVLVQLKEEVQNFGSDEDGLIINMVISIKEKMFDKWFECQFHESLDICIEKCINWALSRTLKKNCEAKVW